MHLDTSTANERIRCVLKNKRSLSEYAPRSYMHTNGFIALTIDSINSQSRRLHWWKGENPIESQAHSHPWKFTSNVLLGTLRLTHYRENPVGTEGCMTLKKYRCTSGENQSGYRFAPRGDSCLKMVSQFSIPKLSNYFLTPSEIHSAYPLEETVTDVFIEMGDGESLIFTENAPIDFNNDYFTKEEFTDKLEELLWRLQ